MNRFTLTLAPLLIALLTLPQAIHAADQYVVVVLDDSGSMNDEMRSVSTGKMDAAREALQTVLADMPDEAEVGVLALNSTVNGSNWIAPLGPVDRATIRQRIASIRAEGSTPLGAAMKDATDALLAARNKQVYGIYRLLIVTDGEASDQELVERYLPEIKARGVVTDVIGVDMSGDHSLATQVNAYRRADDPGSLRQAIAQVFAETSDQDATAGESDYDLLAGLNDEVAAAAVTSLSTTSNQPIGVVAAQSRDAAASGPTSSPTPSTVTATARASDSSGSGMGAVCMGVFFMLVLAAASLAMVSKFGRAGSR